MTHRIAGKIKRRVFDNRQVWRHNSLMGKVKQAQNSMQAVYDAETTTDECKALASKIEGELSVLFRLIHTRKDQQK